MSKLLNVRVLVTGGASGIGLVIARQLLNAGARVHVCDVSSEALIRAGAELDVSKTLADVASESDVDRLFADVNMQLGGLDVLVNNAGIAGPTSPVEQTSLEDWRRTVEVNLTGTFLCTRRAVPLLKATGGGAIINIASCAARLGFPNRSPYSASKWGLIGLTETWAMELGPAGIRVNAVLPGIVAGERQDRVLQSRATLEGIDVKDARRQRTQAVSLRCMVTAEDVAESVVFLCSSAGRMISGQSLSVCGNVETLR
ncbi:MAG: SDR family oxidoreductase [Planctomycetes bacterium]|nr:SDR family oxidoreductase [Planctomycetota bacterium]